MSFFSKIFKNLNPVKLVSDLVGGTLGNVLKIATTVVEGIASGRKFGDILKDVAKQVAVLAVKAAITYFTGGTAGLFINKIIDGAQGLLGKVAEKVLSSTVLSKTVTSFLANKITEFGKSLTTDWFKKQLTDLVLNATGLKSAEEQLDKSKLDPARLTSSIAALFQSHSEEAISEADRSQTLYSLDASYRPQVQDGFDA